MTINIYWGTSKVEESLKPIEWPQVYRQRNEVQENSFRRMIDHGALNINYGRKKIVGPDRHQQRAKEKVEEKLEEAHQKVEKKEDLVRTQQEKVAESERQGHKKRLEQRQQALVVQEEKLKEAKQRQEKLCEQVEALGPPKERADRDFRKQRIMTLDQVQGRLFRTLLLENALISFMAVLCGKLEEKVSLESIRRVLFERSGSRVETPSDVIYWVNTEGLSVPYRFPIGSLSAHVGRGGQGALRDGLEMARQTGSRSPQGNTYLITSCLWADPMSIF